MPVLKTVLYGTSWRHENMGSPASGAKVVSRIICYAGWVLPINMQLLMSITYYVQSILPGAVGMQRKASTVYNPQRSI